MAGRANSWTGGRKHVAAFALAALIGATPSLFAQDSSKVKVEIIGVEGQLERNVLAVMELARAADAGPMTHQRLSRLHHRADEDIMVALRPFGYYRPSVEKWLEYDGHGWVARYDISPGPAVRVKSVCIELAGPGADAPVFQQIKQSFPLQSGDTLRDLLYEAGKLAFLSAAADSGFLDANFDTSAVLVNRDAGTADILLRFHTGPRYKFGPVRFEQDILDEDFLRSRVSFKQGDLFRQDKLLELQTALAEDPYFIRVEVLPQRQEARDLEVPIKVALEPRRQWSEELGLGYGTDTGPRGRSNTNWRRINRRGHYAEANALLSLIEQTISVQYHIPAFIRPTGVLTFLAGVGRLNPRLSDSRAITAGARLFNKRIGWRELISLTYQRTAFEIGVDSAKSSLVIFGGSYERIRSDNQVFPRRGIRTQLEVQGSQKALLSSTSFLQLKGSAKIVYGFMPRFRVLARSEIGYTITKHFRELPPNLRFFTGGDVTVRGFSYLHLAPQDSLGNFIGGPFLMVGSVEVDYQVLPSWAVAVFTDAGNAMQKFTPDRLEQGVGAGIRFVSPLGLIRLDGALGISRKHPPFRLHISIGTDL